MSITTWVRNLYRGCAPDIIWPTNKPAMHDHHEHSSRSLCTCNRCFDGQFLLLSWALSRGCTASIASLPVHREVCAACEQGTWQCFNCSPTVYIYASIGNVFMVSSWGGHQELRQICPWHQYHRIYNQRPSLTISFVACYPSCIHVLGHISAILASQGLSTRWQCHRVLRPWLARMISARVKSITWLLCRVIC